MAEVLTFGGESLNLTFGVEQGTIVAVTAVLVVFKHPELVFLDCA
jgi:hypothetical protein